MKTHEEIKPEKQKDFITKPRNKACKAQMLGVL